MPSQWLVFSDQRTTQNQDPNLLDRITIINAAGTTPTKAEIINAISGYGSFAVAQNLTLCPLAGSVKISVQAAQQTRWTITPIGGPVPQ